MSETPPREPSIRDFLWEHENATHLAFYTAIGRIVIQWGQLEMAFSGNTLNLYTVLGGKALRPAGPPRQLSKKIEFWRECFKKLPGLAAYEKQAAAFADRLSLAKSDRDNLLHHNWGMLLLRNPPSRIVGGSIKTSLKGHALTKAEIGLAELQELTVRIDEINTALLTFTFLLTTTPFRERSGKPGPPPPSHE